MKKITEEKTTRIQKQNIEIYHIEKLSNLNINANRGILSVKIIEFEIQAIIWIFTYWKAPIIFLKNTPNLIEH